MHFPLAIFIGLFTMAHEYYISICDIEYNAEEKSLEIAIQLTTHDLEHATDLQHLGTKLEPANADSVIMEYLLETFSVQHDDKMYELIWIGKEVKLEDMWVYLEVRNIEPFTTLDVTNLILCREFEEQQNRINVKVPGFEDQGTVLSRKNTSHSFRFDR